MPDPSTEMNQIAKEMDEFLEQAREIGLRETLRQVEKTATEVGYAASNSWLGYQANVYYRNFQRPPKDAYFSRRYGLGTWKPYYSETRTSGDWEEYDRDYVTGTIHNRAGNPDMRPALQYHHQARETVTRQQKNLLSILDIESNESSSEFLSQMRREIDRLSLPTEQEILWEWAPEEHTTEDIRAVQVGRLEAPPHLMVLARMQAIENTVGGIKTLGDIARQMELHISRQRQRRRKRSYGGTRVFIGHGRSLAWQELKHFLQDRLGLSTDEFNRVSTAGIATSSRLSTMMDTAGIAFLIMTGEDEQADGSLRARENVIHEAGLFQGQLGFERAIVLLEEGCEEFSNLTGLGQIRFPTGNITRAFEEIRKVLEREGLIGQ